MSGETGNGSWRRASIGEVFEFTQKPRSVRFSDYELIPFVAMDSVPIGYPYFSRYEMRPSSEITTGTYFERGDLLIAKITPSFENGKQGIVGDMPTPFGVATTEVIPVRGIPGVSDTLFLFYYLLSRRVRSELAGRMEGTTGRQRLAKSSLESWSLLLPPLEEQQAIAHALLAVQKAMEARNRELALERERKAALMDYLFTHGTRGEPTKQTEIGEMPESWQVVELGAIAEIAYGLTVNESRRKSVRRAPYLTVANVSRGALHLDEVKEIGMLNGDEENYRLRKGDILFIEGSGNPALLGSAAVWNDELPFALHQNHLIRARLDQSVAFPEWVMNYVNSDFGRSQLLGKGKTSSGLHNINSRVISHIRIPMPTTLEQQAIVEVLLACDRSSKTIEREILVLDEFFHALLEELISGHLAVQSLM